MKKKTILAIAAISVISGLGLTTLSANPNNTKFSAQDKHDNGVLTLTESSQSNPDTQAQATNTDPGASSTPSGGSTPTSGGGTSPTGQSAPQTTSSEPQAPVITVQSATKRTQESGPHKDYYCDLVYSDGTTDEHKMGESNDSGALKASFGYACDQFIGQVK